MRGQRVIVDRDLAEMYGVTTGQLNQQVNRNTEKFPEDFRFTLTSAERAELVANCDRLKGIKFSRVLPSVFTEHGAIQATNVLRSEAAVQMSVQVVRSFVKLRQLVVNHKAIRAKLSELDARIGEHDEQLAVIVETLHQLAEPVSPGQKRRIGF